MTLRSPAHRARTIDQAKQAPLKTTLTGGSVGANSGLRPPNRRIPRIQLRVDMPCSPLLAENIDIG